MYFGKLYIAIGYCLFMKKQRRGRPANSVIRKNILQLLKMKPESYGYEIYKNYHGIFGSVHIRSIYYHLRKGVTLGEIELTRMEEEKGDYSWGDRAERIYYSLGPQGKATISTEVKNYFQKESAKLSKKSKKGL